VDNRLIVSDNIILNKLFSGRSEEKHSVWRLFIGNAIGVMVVLGAERV
jgi:cadmium resistance protein CadD (predicted permease)